MRAFARASLVMGLLLASAARLPGQSQITWAGPTLFVLDLPGTALDEFPRSVKALNGTMTVVDNNGQHMLRASSPSEFLITLSQSLPNDFTVLINLIPKGCCNPEDFMLEGTPARNRGAASVELTWHSGHIMAVGGGGEMYQSDMPGDLAASTPGNLTQIVVTVSGTTIKLYTNGRRMYTLDKQFARGRVLRVWLGGQDEGLNAVYLAGLVVMGGVATPGVTAAGTGQGGSGASSNSSGVTGTTGGSGSTITSVGGGELDSTDPCGGTSDDTSSLTVRSWRAHRTETGGDYEFLCSHRHYAAGTDHESDGCGWTGSRRRMPYLLVSGLERERRMRRVLVP